MDVKDDEMENRLLILSIRRDTKKRFIRKQKRKRGLKKFSQKETTMVYIIIQFKNYDLETMNYISR